MLYTGYFDWKHSLFYADCLFIKNLNWISLIFIFPWLPVVLVVKVHSPSSSFSPWLTSLFSGYTSADAIGNLILVRVMCKSETTFSIKHSGLVYVCTIGSKFVNWRKILVRDALFPIVSFAPGIWELFSIVWFDFCSNYPFMHFVESQRINQEVKFHILSHLIYASMC